MALHEDSGDYKSLRYLLWELWISVTCWWHWSWKSAEHQSQHGSSPEDHERLSKMWQSKSKPLRYFPLNQSGGLTNTASPGRYAARMAKKCLIK